MRSSPENKTVLDRYAGKYVLFVSVVHLLLLTFGIMVHGPCWDETGHLPAGLSHWYTGNFDVYRVNPPLVRLVATAPVLTQHTLDKWGWNPMYDLSRPEWDLGRQLMEQNGVGYLNLLRIARVACLPFSMLAIWIVWVWSRELFGSRGGMLSVTVWAFSPLVLTNAQLITPDTGAAAMGAIACYAFRRWLNNSTMRNALLCGVALGLAELTKFTWLILYVLWPVLWCLHRVLSKRVSEKAHTWRVEIGHLAAILCLSLYIINTGYGFEGTFRKLGEYRFFSNALSGRDSEAIDHWSPGNRFSGSLLEHVPVPLPANMVQGIDRQKVDFDWKLDSYLRGKWQKGGWWYYYVYGLVIKEPIGFILLIALALISMPWIKFTPTGRIEALHLLFPALSLLFFVSSQTGFNHHIRYVLPSLVFFSIAFGVLVSPALLRYKLFPTMAVSFVCMGVIGSLSEFPHSHAYFNILVGGPRNGPLHLLDSNVDWGQDLLLLESWANRNPNRPLDGYSHSLPNSLGIRKITTLPRGEVPSTTDGPKPGRFALSVRSLYSPTPDYSYFLTLPPVETIGRTIRIYELSLDDTNKIRIELGLPVLNDSSETKAKSKSHQANPESLALPTIEKTAK